MLKVGHNFRELEARPGLHDPRFSAGLKCLTYPLGLTETRGVQPLVSNPGTPSQIARLQGGVA